MLPRHSVFIATSLDGFIARVDGSIDWLERANQVVPKGEDCGFKEFFDSVDALVMGRKTFELARTFPEWPYGTTPLVVLSRSAVAIPAALARTVSASSRGPRAIAEELGARGAKRVYVDGGLTIQSFLAEGLIDDLTITRIPVLLGSGLPLFGPLENDIPLELVSSRSWEFGFVQSTYRLANRVPSLSG